MKTVGLGTSATYAGREGGGLSELRLVRRARLAARVNACISKRRLAIESSVSAQQAC